MTQPPTLAPFVVKVAGNEAAVRDGLARVLDRISPLALSTEDSGTVELLLAEALNNIVEHALAGADQPGSIRIDGHGDADGLHLRITDRGTPMPDGQIPSGAMPSVDGPTDALPEGGFGWFMIHALARDVRYDRSGTLNRLSLRIPVVATCSEGGTNKPR